MLSNYNYLLNISGPDARKYWIWVNKKIFKKIEA